MQLRQLRQLKQTPPPPLRRLAGRLVVGLLATFGAGGALVSHAGTAVAPAAPAASASGLYQVDMQWTTNGKAAWTKVRVKAGEPFTVSINDGANTSRGDFVLSRVDERAVYLKGVIKHNDRVSGNPALMVALSQAASIRLTSDQPAEELSMQLTVTQAPAQGQ